MTARPPVDPELAEAFAILPHTALPQLAEEELRELRATSMVPLPEDPLDDLGVEHVEHEVPRPDGSTLALAVLRRRDGSGRPGPALVQLHGGGLLMGNRFTGIEQLARWVAQHDAVGVSVGYRLAPEHPWPAAHEDAVAALAWLHENAADLGADPGLVVLVGTSAGGGLAAGAALRARDEGGPPVHALLLLAPMLDDRDATASAHQHEDGVPWDRADNRFAWRAYLGEAAGGPDVPAYAAAGRATELAGMPRTYLGVGAAEVFRDEGVALASLMWEAGVDCELHVWAGAVHGFELFADAAAVADQAVGTADAWLSRVIAQA